MGRGGSGVRAASATSIEITFIYRGLRCRERLALEPTAANLKRAVLHRAAILDAISRGIFDYRVTFPKSKRAARFARQPGDVKTVEHFLSDWIDRKKAQVKASTWQDYYNVVQNVLIPKFGSENLSDVTRATVREWCAGLTAGNKRISNILSVFRSALDEAAEDELIPVNPLAGWTYTKREGPKPEDDVDPFSADEQAAILNACGDEQVRSLVRFAFWTGLRTSELIALDWADVDWHRGEVLVRKALTRYADAVEDTKTRAGRRAVKLLPPALEALEAQRRHTELAGAHVFADPRVVVSARWADDHAIWWLWQGILKRAKVRYRRPYQTRHTYASMMLSAGESPMWVAQQMGHRDWGMIRRIYGRWIPDANPEAGAKAVAMFSPVMPAAGKMEDVG